MLNRTDLESTYAHLLDYQTRLSTLIGALAAFLQVDPATIAHAAVAEVAAAATAPIAAPPPVATRRQASPAPKTSTPRAVTANTVQATGQRILAALAKQGSAARPGDLVDATGVSAATFRQALAVLEKAGQVSVTGATISRRVTLTDRGRAALSATPSATPSAATAQAAVTDAEVVAARDKAIKERLKAGPATFAQLLQALPGEFPSSDAKVSALKASLRRLTLRSEVIDVADKFKLAA